MIFDVGDVAVVKASVTNGESGKAVDPSEPLFRVLTPAGETEDLTATKVQSGHYSCEFSCAEAGAHRLLFLGTGTNAVAGETQFRVRKPLVSRS